jgi:tetratricopeptide (TPR) repeat protein
MSVKPARVGVALRRLPAALLVLSLLAACSARDPLEEARKKQASQDFAGSLEILRNLVTEHPQDLEVHYLYGVALVRTGQPSLAIWSLRRAMEDPRWLVPAGRELATSALATGNADEAVEVMNRVVEKEPTNIDSLLLRAEAKVATRRDYEGALADAEKAVAQDPDHIDALVMRTVALLMLGRADEAQKALVDLEARAEDVDLGLDLGAKFCMAHALFAKAKQQWDEAEKLHEKCLADFPSNPSVIAGVVDFYDERERPERSIEILQGVVAADPLASAARVSLAGRLEAAGRKDEALKVLREGTEVRDAELASVGWVDLANYYDGQGNYSQAAEALGHAVERTKDPRPELLFQWADTLVMAGQIPRAREVAQKLEVPAHRELVEARALFREGRLREALAHYDEGLRLWPDNSVARYYAARTAERLGDFDRAVDQYRYAIRSGMGSTNARFRLARLHEAEHAFEQAVGVARESSAAVPEDLDANMVALRVLARRGRLEDFRPFVRWHSEHPETWGRAVAAMAQGVRERSGPAEAARFVKSIEHFDLTDPRNADALRELVISLAASGESARGVAAANAAVAKHPDAAVLYGVQGLALAVSGADAAAVRAAYERALALDASHEPALLGLARIAAKSGDTDGALGLYARAAATQEDVELGDPEPWREAAELLVSAGRKDEAIRQLDALLEHDPYDGKAALRLAALRAAQPDGADASLALAQRAARFGAGADAFDLLAKLYAQRGDTEKASAAQARAERARSGAHEAEAAAAPAS